MNLNSITGLAGVTVMAGATPFVAQGSANDGTVITGTLTSNGMRMGNPDGPAFTVFDSINGLTSADPLFASVTGFAAFTQGQVIQNTGTTPSVGRVNSVGIHSQFNSRAGVSVNNDNDGDTVITLDGRYFIPPIQSYYLLGTNVLTSASSIAGSGDPNTNREYFAFGGIRPTGTTT